MVARDQRAGLAVDLVEPLAVALPDLVADHALDLERVVLHADRPERGLEEVLGRDLADHASPALAIRIRGHGADDVRARLGALRIERRGGAQGEVGQLAAAAAGVAGDDLGHRAPGIDRNLQRAALGELLDLALGEAGGDVPAAAVSAPGDPEPERGDIVELVERGVRGQRGPRELLERGVVGRRGRRGRRDLARDDGDAVAEPGQRDVDLAREPRAGGGAQLVLLRPRRLLER